MTDTPLVELRNLTKHFSLPGDLFGWCLRHRRAGLGIGIDRDRQGVIPLGPGLQGYSLLT